MIKILRENKTSGNRIKAISISGGYVRLWVVKTEFMNKSDINERTREYCKNNPLNDEKLPPKKWLILSDVMKIFKCGYKDLIIKSSSQKINPIQIDGDIWFFRDDLERVFDYKAKT